MLLYGLYLVLTYLNIHTLARITNLKVIKNLKRNLKKAFQKIDMANFLILDPPSEWTKWGPCVPSCGPGQRERTRDCPKQPCHGDLSETEACQNRLCPIRKKSHFS